MTTADDKPTAEVSAWLDGLAGRRLPGAAGETAEGQAHAEALLMREALLGQGDSSLAPVTSDEEWQQLLQRGLPAAASNEALLEPREAAEVPQGEALRLRPPALGRSAPVSAIPSEQPARRLGLWRRPVWAVAAGVGCLALLFHQLPPDTLEESGARSDQLRGGANGSSAVWRSDQPAQDAEQLQAALRAAGAVVLVQTAPEGGLQLLIESAPAARDAVNAVLAPLDTALDADGKLGLRVIPAASSPR